MIVTELRPDTLDRMVRAVEKVRERLLRATDALERAEIPYAVAGGNAVGAWVAQVDEGAVRNTVDVDLLVDRSRFDEIKACLESVGFVHAFSWGVDLFLDGPDGKPRQAIRLVYAGEKVKPDSLHASPHLNHLARYKSYQVVSLEPLVHMKLIANRPKDQAHLLDFREVGLIDESWIPRLPEDLATRLKKLFEDNPAWSVESNIYRPPAKNLLSGRIPCADSLSPSIASSPPVSRSCGSPGCSPARW